MPKKEERYRDKLPKKSYKEKQEDYQWRESKHRKRELFHEDVYFGYEEYIKWEFDENKAIHITAKKSEELEKLVRRRKHLRLESLNIKPDARSSKEVQMESNTTKTSEDPGHVQETKKNHDELNGSAVTQKVGEGGQLDGSDDTKASSKDKTPKSLQNKRRASVCVEMENDKESQKSSITGDTRDKTSTKEAPTGRYSGDKISANDDAYLPEKIQGQSENIIEGGKFTVKAQNHIKDENTKEKQPTADCGNDKANAKGECRKIKKSTEQPAQPVISDEGRKGSQGVFRSFRNVMKGMF